MRLLLRASFVGVFCLAIAVGAVFVLMPSDQHVAKRGERRVPVGTAPRESPEARGSVPKEGQGRVFDIVVASFEDGGFSTASRYMAPLRDPGSLQELREAVRWRGRRGITEVRAALDRLRLDAPPTREQVTQRVKLLHSLGLLYMYEGKFDEAAAAIEQALDAGRAPHVKDDLRLTLTALRGIIGLRCGEVENCLECCGPSSCIFPIVPEAVHRHVDGSREAVQWFTRYLGEKPNDLRVLWLLNVASMTLGEYPDKVPPQYRIPLEPFRSKLDVGRFANVAKRVGLGARGPNLAGGSIFDDFTGDGLPDIFTTSLDADLGASLWVNRGDGQFDDRSVTALLGDQIYALNVTRTDYDNDGDLDVLLLRGAWEFPLRMSLLRNRGDGTFDDVTVTSGLDEPIACESAAWGDYDNDGWLDVFVCGEYMAPGAKAPVVKPDARNRCRLYHNQGDGTFVDVAARAGVTNERCAKGSAWGDYDGDGRLDLFVSNMGQECRLYHNEGGGKFRDVAPELGVTGTNMSFACWFWDYDNDGWLDLHVNDYRAQTAEILATRLGASIPGSSRPRLYRNLEGGGFRDVTAEAGLDRPMAPMGSNFGDIDNDGYLDVYLGTGAMSYSGLDVNVLLKNVEGARFEDVTDSSGTGRIQKGHGVSFADWNGDGDLDLFVEYGGATPGDQAYNVLYQNPGHNRHWLKLKLVGTKTNHLAIGAKVRVDVVGADGRRRSIYRTIGNNSSFGGNSLVETVGLLDATRVEELTVSWPTSGTEQKFRGIPADQEIEITEGADAFKRRPQVTHSAPNP